MFPYLKATKTWTQTAWYRGEQNLFERLDLLQYMVSISDFEKNILTTFQNQFYRPETTSHFGYMTLQFTFQCCLILVGYVLLAQNSE